MNRSANRTTEPAASRRRRQASLLLLFTLLAVASAGAQEPSAAAEQREDGPPPLRYLPEESRRRLEGERDPKARARLSMVMAEECLVRAAQHAEADRFVAATGEVGVYEAIVEDTIRFLHGSGRVNNKLRDTFKRVEITLRSHVTRLESIRRSLPSQHAVYLKDAIEFVRDNRDKALGAFYDDTVIREPHRPAVTTPAGERATSNAHARPEDEKKPDQRR